MQKQFVDLSILIVTWNGDELLSDCLGSIRGACGEAVEIVVVDNANLESTRKIVSAHENARYVASAVNLGFAGGNNLGLDACTRKYVLLLNNDTIVHERSFVEMVDYLESHPQVAAVQGKMVLPLDGGRLDACGYLMTPYGPRVARTRSTTRAVIAGKGACLMFRRSVIDELGGVLFHGFFFNNHEEIDFCHRVWLAGYEVHYVDSPSIDHLNSRTFKKNPRRQTAVAALMMANYYTSLLTVFEKRNLLMIVGRSFLLDVFFFCALVATFKWRKASVYPRAIVRVFGRIPTILKIRHVVQSSRKTSDREIFDKVMVRPPLIHYLRAIRGIEENLPY